MGLLHFLWIHISCDIDQLEEGQVVTYIKFVKYSWVNIFIKLVLKMTVFVQRVV